VVEALNGAGIDYMVTGSVVSSLQGEPRATHDLDVVISLEQRSLPALVAAFPKPQFYVDEQAAREAVQTRGTFNLIETTEGGKVDFWMLTDSAFDQSRFSRKYEEIVFGIRLKVSAPEDTILQKLSWAKLSGGSVKLYGDALRVFEVQFAGLDQPYLTDWARMLEVDDLLEQIRREAVIV
jgi:hypothetical protein